jgi:GAF domain-containing protein
MIESPGRLTVLGNIDLDNPELRDRLNVLTERTAARLGQPISLVSMVLDSAQLFLGAHGLQGWLAEVGGSPIEWSLCANVVTTGEQFVVSDAAADTRLAANPVVAADGVRAYAGAPIVVDGAVLGAHCVVGFESHTFTDVELAELRDGADEVADLLRAYPYPD